MQHRGAIRVLDENGAEVVHTPELIARLFDEELKRIIGDLPAQTSPEEFPR
jgi:hypothetical protein